MPKKALRLPNGKHAFDMTTVIEIQVRLGKGMVWLIRLKEFYRCCGGRRLFRSVERVEEVLLFGGFQR